MEPKLTPAEILYLRDTSCARVTSRTSHMRSKMGCVRVGKHDAQQANLNDFVAERLRVCDARQASRSSTAPVQQLAVHQLPGVRLLVAESSIKGRHRANGTVEQVLAMSKEDSR